MHTIGNTLFVGKVWMHLPALDSTNTYALELLSKSNPAEGTVISADFQRQGRGQLGSSWQAEAGQNIITSFILYPVFISPRHQFHFNQAIALSVYDFVSAQVSATVRIKWPNDIYVDDKKLGGILIQNNVSPNSIKSSVAGIGINVNQLHFPENLPNPCSLAQLTAKTYDIRSLIALLGECVEKRYLQLRRGQIEQIQKDYILCLYRFMEDSLFRRIDGHVFSGRITGLSETGKLLIHHQDGEEAFGLKEIQFL